MLTKKISGIYCIRQINGNGLYVGSSVDVHKRWREHKSALTRGNHHNPHLQNAWDFHTEYFFDFEILEIVSSHLVVNGRSLISLEQKWIDLLKPCYNVCPAAGSSLGRKNTPEARAKIGAGNKGKKITPEHRAKISVAQKGKTHTPEARAKMSVAQKGRIHTPETKANMSAAQKGKKQTPEHRANSVAGRVKARLLRKTN